MMQTSSGALRNAFGFGETQVTLANDSDYDGAQRIGSCNILVKNET